MNRFISPIGLVRWAGAGVLGSLVAFATFAMRAQDEGMLTRSAFEFYSSIIEWGLFVAVVSFAVVGLGLLTAQRPALKAEPASERERSGHLV